MLTNCWSDGTSCLPMDFALLSSSDAKKRLCDSQKALDKRCCAHQRRKESTEKATAHLENMVKRILCTGVSAKYLLMEGWFTMPATVVVLAQHLKVIGMAKEIQCRDFDAIMDTALQCVGLSKNKLVIV